MLMTPLKEPTSRLSEVALPPDIRYMHAATYFQQEDPIPFWVADSFPVRPLRPVLAITQELSCSAYKIRKSAQSCVGRACRRQGVKWATSKSEDLIAPTALPPFVNCPPPHPHLPSHPFAERLSTRKNARHTLQNPPETLECPCATPRHLL